MTIPRLSSILLTTLRFVRDNDAALTGDIDNAVGEAAGISESDRAVGQRRSPLGKWQNLVTAAIRELKAAKLVEGRRGGPYRVSAAGRELLASNRPALTVTELRKLRRGIQLPESNLKLSSTTDALESIRPRIKRSVLELVSHAGIDVSDWSNYANGTRSPAANPKYCYEWSFVETGKVVVLNLWFEGMKEDSRGLFQRFNFRSNVRNRGKAVWVKRALKLDAAIQTAAREALPVRVVVCSGKVRKSGGKDAIASKVHTRDLDPAPWAVTVYDVETGACEMRRGAVPVVIMRSVNGKSQLSVSRLFAAFKATKRKISRAQMAMLRGHYYSEARTASTGHLAEFGGLSSYQAGNFHYGKMCRQLAEVMTIAPTGDNISVLATIAEKKNAEGHTCWRMDANVATALERLKWVSANAMPPPADLDPDDLEMGNVAETTKKALRAARVGQGGYRARLLAIWDSCSVTTCAERSLLVASHIVPWKGASNIERLDAYNGLLLTPNLDKLFNDYWISFSSRGQILVSRFLGLGSLKSLGVRGRENLRQVPTKTMAYIQRHREEFERREGSRDPADPNPTSP